MKSEKTHNGLKLISKTNATKSNIENTDAVGRFAYFTVFLYADSFHLTGSKKCEVYHRWQA